MGRILKVPEIKQLPAHCGPASLSMVAFYYGNLIDQVKIGEMAGLNPKEGVYPPNLVRCARDLEFTSQGFHNLNFKDLTEFIEKGFPLIVRVQSILKGSGHIMVAKGYNKKEEIYFNDPFNARELKIDYNKLENIWKVDNFNDRKRWKTNNYGILVKPRNNHELSF
jgi:ABC-type bacteriocin/lantibiotic exporter with double-glycine peptidase domain